MDWSDIRQRLDNLSRSPRKTSTPFDPRCSASQWRRMLNSLRTHTLLFLPNGKHTSTPTNNFRYRTPVSSCRSNSVRRYDVRIMCCHPFLMFSNDRTRTRRHENIHLRIMYYQVPGREEEYIFINYAQQCNNDDGLN